MGGKKKYIEMFGSFTEPVNWHYIIPYGWENFTLCVLYKLASWKS